MKNRSIQTRVTAFYSSILILMTVLLMAFLFVIADTQVQSVSKSTLEETVKEAVNSITYYDDSIEIDSDFDFYANGVTILMYGPTGTSLLGSAPSGFPSQTPLVSDTFQTVTSDDREWMVYDLYIRHPNAVDLWIRGVYPMSTTLRTLQSVQRIALIGLPAFLLLALFGGWLITRRAFQPVAQIRKAAEEIGSGTDLTRRIELHESRDELYDLAVTLNDMIARLQAAFENERQFTSDVSHELRTPVAVILSQCDYVLEGEHTEDEYREALMQVRSQTRRMSSLISQLLELSRTVNAQSLLRREPVDLVILCESICESMEALAEERGIHIETDFPEELAAVVDETLFVRLLTNLMMNAVRYGRDGGWIRVRLRCEEKQVRLSVTDNGIGIAEENRERIFRRLYREDASRHADSEENSFGLGLAFVRWIAEAHGGTVSVKSRKGEGSEFLVELPISAE